MADSNDECSILEQKFVDGRYINSFDFLLLYMYTFFLVWSDGETRLLLEKYSEYLSLIGPMKRFKFKKNMWAQICADLALELACFRTAQQCESRYKTIMKRKRSSEANNKTSGAKRKKIEFEEEFSRIRNLDDSIEPEVQISTQNMTVKEYI